jgi:filamentous hemagglutinin family protein
MQYRILFIVVTSLLNVRVSADIVLDSTLGQSRSLQGPHFAIGAELGQQHGGNLFHSFERFNIYKGETARFSGPNTVKNVISRVTGNTESTLNGLLRSTIPDADFYFLNPAGVIFGKEAQLDVQGSFYISTADYLRLGDKGQFNSTQPENSLLTVAPPTAFGFLDPKPITVRGSKLTVPETQILSITAGDINLNQAGLHASAGNIHLVSVASAGEVNINPNTTYFNRFAQLGQIKLFQSTVGNSFDDFDGAQNIYIRGGQFYLEDSMLNARVQYRTGAASEINISSREAVTLAEDAVVSTDSFGANNAGHITIDTNTLTLQSNALINSNTQRGGAAGNITIHAHHVLIKGPRKEENQNITISSSHSHGGGPSGRILITAATVEMTGNMQIKTTSRDTDEAAGQIIIEADSIKMAGDATLNTMTFAKGDGGEISIEAKTLTLTDEAWIISSSFGQGQSGPIDITVDTLDLSKESVIAATTFSQGKGGNITLYVGNALSITDAAVVTSGTEGQGHGGNIFIVLPANYKMTTAEAGSISTASGAKNVVTNKIASFLDLAKQLGGKIDGSIFAGGGKSGQVYITDKDQFVDSVATSLADASRLLISCVESVKNESHFVVADYLSDADREDMLKTPQPPSFKGLTKAEILATYQSLQEQLATSTRQSEILAQLAALYAYKHRYPEALQLNKQALRALKLLTAPYWRYKLQWQRGRLFNALGEHKNAMTAYQTAIQKLGTIRHHLTKIYRDRYPNGERSEFREVLKPIFTELVALLLDLSEPLQEMAKNELLKQALQTMDKLKTAELQDYFQDDCPKPTIGLEEVDPLHTAIIYPIFLPNRVELLVSLPQAQRFHQTVPATPKQLTQTINTLASQLNCQTCQKDRYRDSAQKLYDWLLRPLEPALSKDKINTLVFVPDGPLYSIPMAVLHDGHQFLIEKYALAITPSLTITQPTTKHFSPKMLYSALTASNHPNFAPIQQYVTPMQYEFEKTFGSITTLKGRSFIHDNLSQALHIPHTITHVFSHAQFSQQVSNTFIVTYNEKLSMNQLEQLIAPKQHSSVPLELLSLSACETAKGNERAALGLAGIAYKAGARSAIATLWSVTDDVVYHLFRKFYQELIEKQQPKAQAMRQAQLMLLKEYPSYQHPYYWGAFLLIGHWL